MENKQMTQCKACSKEIAKGVKKCPHCGKDQRNFFAKHKVLTLILAVGIIGAIAAMTGGGDKPTPSASNNTTQTTGVKETKTEEVEEVIVVSAVDLAKAYEENEVRADKEYKGKIVEVKGKVQSIGVIAGQTYVVLSSEKDFAITDIQCNFKDEAEIDKVADLDEGDEVTIKGKVDGKSLNVSINDCVFK